MPGRAVSATLTADVGGYIAAMNRAAQATRQFATRASSSIKSNEGALNSLSNKAGLLGVGVAAGVGVAVKTFADFDSAMSSVAATGTDAKQNLTALRDVAIQAGAATKFSATEAAGGIESLAKAGVSAKDTIGGGLNGALNLAAAGNLNVADSAEVAATAMTQFNLTGKDVPHIADLIAAGAGKAQGEVSDMAAALKQSGLVASQFGLSIEETTGTLASFASAGLIGSDAGTSFRTMLLRLANPSVQSADLMKQLGVSAYDAAGNFVGITDLAGQLKKALDPLPQAQRDAALATIFGSDAIRAANVLYQQGSSGIQQWVTNVNDSGFAAQVAATKMDNLKGDLEQLRGSFETALIGLGEGANGPLRSLVQQATDAVNAFNGLSTGTKSTLLAIGAGLAAVALSAAGVGKLVIAVNNAKVALNGLGISARAAGIASLGIGAAIGIAALAYGHYAAQAAVSRQRVDDFTTALQSQTGAIQANVTAVAAKSLQDSGALAAARNLGVSLDTATQAALGNADALRTVGAATDAAFQAGLNSSDVGVLQRVDDARTLSDAIRGVGNDYNGAVQNAKDFAAASGTAAASSRPDVYQQAATSLAKIGTSAGDAATGVDDLAHSLFDLNQAALNASNAQIGFEAAIDAASEAAKKNGRNLKVSSAAGRENRTALNNLAGASQKYIESLVQQGASTSKVTGATRTARSSFIAAATSMGLSKTAAGKLATAYGLVPKNVKTKVSAPGATQSKTQADAVRDAIKKLPPSKRIIVQSAFNRGGIAAARAALASLPTSKTVTITTRNVILAGGKKIGSANAEGGLISGPGTDTSDDVPAWLSTGEYVLRAAAVRAIGVDRLHELNAQGFATGGLVGQAQTADIYRLIASALAPLAGIASLARNVVTAQRAGAGPTATYQNAYNAYSAAVRRRNTAVDRRDDLRDDVARLKRRADATKGTTKADRDYARARDRLAAANRTVSRSNTEVTRTSAAKTKATEAYNAAAAKTKDATSALAEAQKQLADSARQVSDRFIDQFRSTSTDAQDWIDLMRQGTTELAAFNAKIARLRRSGLSETLIQQILGMGAGAGGELASSILGGGAGLVSALNKANASLQLTADKLGYFAATGSGRYASGGPVSGSGSGTSDSVPIWASNGEWVVPQRAVADNRGYLEAITYGRSVVSNNFARSNYASGGMVRAPHIDMGAVRGALAGMAVYVENPWTGEYHEARMRSVAGDVLDRETSRAVTRY